MVSTDKTPKEASENSLEKAPGKLPENAQRKDFFNDLKSLQMLVMLLAGILIIASLAWVFDEVLEDEEEDDDGNGSDVVYNPVIDPNDFVDTIDNPYLPFTRGNSWVYEGETEDGTERIEVVVTNDTKVIMGVTCTVVRDTVSIEGEIIEDTYDWFAQDKEGNVWYFGEDSKEYDDGEIDTAGSWEAGVDGAKPGVLMMANPLAGFTYRQEYYRGEAEDMAQVIHLNQTVTIGDDTYNNVLVTLEWNPLEPGDDENKYYAPGIGVIMEVQVKGDSEQVELIEFTTG